MAMCLMMPIVNAYPTVVISPSATQVERYAATQLSLYLGNMSKMLDVEPIAGNNDTIAVGYDAAVKLGVTTPVLSTDVHTTELIPGHLLFHRTAR